MRWHDHIHRDPSILAGKPVVRGTRLSAAFLSGLFEEGWTEQDILESYPQLSREGLRAAFAYSAERARDGSMDADKVPTQG